MNGKERKKRNTLLPEPKHERCEISMLASNKSIASEKPLTMVLGR